MRRSHGSLKRKTVRSPRLTRSRARTRESMKIQKLTMMRTKKWSKKMSKRTRLTKKRRSRRRRRSLIIKII
jgi:hypothetical protein